MKKVLFAFISLVFIPGIIWAQRTESQTNPSEEAPARPSGRLLKFSELDQRAIYHWGNGQRSTAAGRTAGHDLRGYLVKVIGDSAFIVKAGSETKESETTKR